MSEIINKLNLTRYSKKVVLNCPSSAQPALKELIFDTSFEKERYDLIFTFVFSLAEMKKLITTINQKQLLETKGYLYIAYPKITSRNYVDGIGRDTIFPYLHVDEETGIVEQTTLKFSRMVKFDEDFTVIGLQWATSKNPPTKPSQRVSDYQHFIPEIQQKLRTNPKEKTLFESLTPGYQRDWARYLYAPQQESTKKAHFEEMLSILQQGFKSKNLYQQSLKNNS